MVEVTKKKAPATHEPKPDGAKRDYAQRAHDTVREVERRHADRHKDDEKPSE